MKRLYANTSSFDFLYNYSITFSYGPCQLRLSKDAGCWRVTGHLKINLRGRQGAADCRTVA